MSHRFDLDELSDLPGSQLVRRGLLDLHAHEVTPEGLLLAAAATRLRRLGVPVSDWAAEIADPEISLYQALCEQLDGAGDDPYLRYNSWRRELDSFVSALEHRQSR